MALVGEDAASFQTDINALEGFVVENLELEQLESLLDEFNVFEAIGMVSQEVKHSNFLSFLLDPRQGHGMGDYFLKKFLQKALKTNRSVALPVSLVDLDVWSLDGTLVLREWNNIDLLLLNDELKLAVIIENKVYAGEGGGQLDRYYTTVQQSYPDFRVLAFFLTPEGSPPSHENYLPSSYRQVAELLDTVLDTRSSQLGADIQTMITHYVRMLRRNILTDAKIDDLCLRIYQKHKRALDLIYERRPDPNMLQQALAEGLKKVLSETPGIAFDHCDRGFVSFSLTSWDKVIPWAENKWSNCGRVIRFWFDNGADRMNLSLEIGPGPSDLREKLYDIAVSNSPLLKPASRTLSPFYCRIMKFSVLTKQDYDNAEFDTLLDKATNRWKDFTNTHLPLIEEAILRGFAGDAEDGGDSQTAQGCGPAGR